MDLDEDIRNLEIWGCELRTVTKLTERQRKAIESGEEGRAAKKNGKNKKEKDDDDDEPVASTSKGVVAVAKSSSLPQQQQSSMEPFDLMSLPDVVLRRVLSFLSYDTAAKLRMVNKKFDGLCQSHLNIGFRAVERRHGKLMKRFKAKLPRRESERRNHPLIRHCDILTAVETRISLLAMTFMKYVDVELCCFIPGKVIDELFDVLRKIEVMESPMPRAYEVLQELRDISSMAMEYFDEKIVPSLKVNETRFQSPAVYMHGMHGYLSATPRSSYSPCMTSSPARNATSAPSSPTTSTLCSHSKRLLAAERKIRTLTKKNRRMQKDVDELQQLKQSFADLTATVGSLESNYQALVANQSEKLKEQERRIRVLTASSSSSSSSGWKKRSREAENEVASDDEDDGESSSASSSAKRAKISR